MKSAGLILLGFSILPNFAEAQECPLVFSVPATQWEVQCRASEMRERCSSPISIHERKMANQDALHRGLIDHDAFVWLEINETVVLTMFNQIATICPAARADEL